MLPVKPEIYLVDLTLPRDLFLMQHEEERAARFRFSRDATAWSRARSALRENLAIRLGAEPLGLQFETGLHGKPFLRDRSLHFNLSHSADWAAIAISDEAPIGIDIERVRTGVDMKRLLHRIGEPAPDTGIESLFQLWARREARSKATGGALLQPPDPDVVSADLFAPEGYVAAVALLGRRPIVETPADRPHHRAP